MIKDYLESKNYHFTASTLIDELGMKKKEFAIIEEHINQLQDAISQGNWEFIKQNINWIPEWYFILLLLVIEKHFYMK